MSNLGMKKRQGSWPCPTQLILGLAQLEQLVFAKQAWSLGQLEGLLKKLDSPLMALLQIVIELEGSRVLFHYMRFGTGARSTEERACSDEKCVPEALLQEETCQLDEGQLIAYAVWEGLFPDFELQRMAVHPSVRRQGLAGLLLEEAKNFARGQGVHTLQLECASGNVAAQVCYRQQGFVEVGRRRAYYGDEDAILMDAVL